MASSLQAYSISVTNGNTNSEPEDGFIDYVTTTGERLQHFGPAWDALWVSSHPSRAVWRPPAKAVLKA